MDGLSSRIILYNVDGEEIGSILVPGEVGKEDIGLELRIGVRLVVRGSRRKKRKTFEVDVRDEELAERIKKYIENLELEIRYIESKETPADVVRLGEIIGEKG